MSDGRIILHADGSGVAIEFRSAAIDVVQPVGVAGYASYSNVQVGNRIYQVRESREQIEALRAAADAETSA